MWTKVDKPTETRFSTYLRGKVHTEWTAETPEGVFGIVYTEDPVEKGLYFFIGEKGYSCVFSPVTLREKDLQRETVYFREHSPVGSRDPWTDCRDFLDEFLADNKEFRFASCRKRDLPSAEDRFRLVLSDTLPHRRLLRRLGYGDDDIYWPTARRNRETEQRLGSLYATYDKHAIGEKPMAGYPGQIDPLAIADRIIAELDRQRKRKPEA